MCQELTVMKGKRGWNRVIAFANGDDYTVGVFAAQSGKPELEKFQAWLQRLVVAREHMYAADKALGTEECRVTGFDAASAGLYNLALAASDQIVQDYDKGFSAAVMKTRIRIVAGILEGETEAHDVPVRVAK